MDISITHTDIIGDSIFAIKGSMHRCFRIANGAAAKHMIIIRGDLEIVCSRTRAAIRLRSMNVA